MQAQLAELQQARHASDAELRAGAESARQLSLLLDGRVQEVAALAASKRLVETRLATAEHELRTARQRNTVIRGEGGVVFNCRVNITGRWWGDGGGGVMRGL